MELKNIFIFILILLIIILGLAFFFQGTNDSGNDKVIVVGASNFTIPDGYEIGNDNSDGAKNITNGKNDIFIMEHKGADVTKYINDYDAYFNQTETIENLNISGYEVYKLTPPNTSNTHHFYFVKNNKVYDIYHWDGNLNIDSEVVKILTPS